MVAALPAHIRLKLKQTLSQWRHWDCAPPLASAPEPVSVLGPGLSNFNVLVTAAEQRFVVRLDGIDPAAHSLSRQGEWRCLGAAHRAGLAPRPRYFNPELGSLVCDYLPPDQEQPLVIADIARLLRQIHRLPPRHHRLHLEERLCSYEKRLAQRDAARSGALREISPAIHALLAVAADGDPALALCHNDLLRANRLYCGGTLYALDWEYSAMASPWYDLAVVAAGDGLGPAATEELLLAYSGGSVGDSQRMLVARYGCVYRYLEILWYLSRGQPALDEAALQRRFTALARELERVGAP